MQDINDLDIDKLRQFIASITPDNVCRRAQIERLEALLQEKLSLINNSGSTNG
jgi:hypothetical protein